MTAQRTAAKNGRWWWLLLASFAVSATVLAPAALLERATGGTPSARTRFVADAGTIWSGRGRIAIIPDSTPIVIPIAWRFDPRALSGLRLGYFIEVNAPVLSGSAHLGLGFGSLELRDAAVSADARLLSMAHPAAALFAPAGKIRLQQSADEQFSVRAAANDKQTWRVDGLMGLQAEQLAFGGVVNAPVGSHEFKLRGDGLTINVSILRSNGPLKLEGTGSIALAPPRRFTFSGFATVPADAPAALKQLGPTLSDGRQRIELNTTW